MGDVRVTAKPPSTVSAILFQNNDVLCQIHFFREQTCFLGQLALLAWRRRR
jgi:hypothetical protein